MRWLLILICLIVLYGPPAWAVKQEPPARLSLIFIEAVQIEDHIGQDMWDEAIKNGKAVSEMLEKVAPEIRKAAGEDNWQAMIEAVSLMQNSLLEKNRPAVYDRLLVLENILLHIMDFFAYAVHPAFILLQEYVDETAAAVRIKDYERLNHEIREMSNIINVSSSVMAKNGVGKGMQSDFVRYLETLKTAVEEQDLQKLKNVLEKMEVLSGAFLWIGSRQ